MPFMSTPQSSCLVYVKHTITRDSLLSLVWQTDQDDGTRIKCTVEGRLFDDGSRNFEEVAHAVSHLVLCTDPPLAQFASKVEKAPTSPRLERKEAMVLSEGCLESRNWWSGIVRRGLSTVVDTTLEKQWLGYCETAYSEVTWVDTKDAVNIEGLSRFKVKTCGAPSQQWLEENGWQRCFFYNDTYPYYLKRGSEDIHYQHPFAFASDEGPPRAVDLSTGEINFSAKSTRLRMPAHHIEERANITSELDPCPSIRHFCVFDENDHVVGVVLADPQVMRELQLHQKEMVEWDPSYSEEEKRFMHITDWPVIPASEVSPDKEFKPRLVDEESEWDF